MVGAQLTDGNSYRGQQVTCAVRDGVATPVDRVDLEAADRTGPRLRAGPATGGPLSFRSVTRFPDHFRKAPSLPG